MKTILMLSAVLLIAGCTTPAKEYRAPSDARVKAATTDLNIKVDRARDTARKAKLAAEAAKAIHIRMVAQAGTVKELFDKLAGSLPPEYKGPVREVSDALDALLGQNTELQKKLDELTAWNRQLETQLAEAEKARITLTAAQDGYAGAAAELAGQATIESKQRFEAQSQLLKEKFLSILWKVCGGGIILIIIAVIVMWKLGWKAIKL